MPLARRRISYHYCTTLLGLAKFSRNLPGRYRIPAGDAGMPSGVDDIMPIWLLLGLAIVAEVVGTSLLKLSEGFSRPGPTLGTLACYGLAFYLLALTLDRLSVGIAYAIWSGVGVSLIALVGWLVFGQRLLPAELLGIGLIVLGVVLVSLAPG